LPYGCKAVIGFAALVILLVILLEAFAHAGEGSFGEFAQRRAPERRSDPWQQFRDIGRQNRSLAKRQCELLRQNLEIDERLHRLKRGW